MFCLYTLKSTSDARKSIFCYHNSKGQGKEKSNLLQPYHALFNLKTYINRTTWANPFTRWINCSQLTYKYHCWEQMKSWHDADKFIRTLLFITMGTWRKLDFKQLKNASSRSALWQCQNLVSIKAEERNQRGLSIKLAVMIKPEQTHWGTT